MNNVKAFALMGGLSILLVLIGRAVGGQSGAIIFLAISLAINFFSYYYSDKLVIKMTGAQEITEAQSPQIFSVIRKLTARAGIPMPRIYVTPSMQPNAFATGRNPEHSAVAVTQGLLKILNQDEVEGVSASNSIFRIVDNSGNIKSKGGPIDPSVGRLRAWADPFIGVNVVIGVSY